MRTILNRFCPVRAPDAGGDAPPAAPPAGADTGAGGTPPAGGASPPAGDPPAAPPAAGAIYRPDGMPDHYAGQTDRETIDKLFATTEGYRRRDAEAQIPDSPDAYKTFPDDLPEPVRPYVAELTADPLFDKVAAKAHALKVPVPVLHQLTTEMLGQATEMGLFEPPLDVAAEKAALVPEAARGLPEAEQTAAREKRMNENFQWVDAMTQRGADQGGLPREVGDYAKTMLGDTAKGHHFFEWVRGQIGARGPAGDGTGTGGGDARAELDRRAGLPENMPGNVKFDQKSYAQLQKDFQAAFPERE